MNNLVYIILLQGTQSEWRVVFYILAAVLLFGASFFLVFAQGETQEWAKGISEYDGNETAEHLAEDVDERKVTSN